MDFRRRFHPCRPLPGDRCPSLAVDGDAAFSVATLERRLEKDRTRVVHSASLRRLQLLPQQGAVLAHASQRRLLSASLERQQMGRRIVQMVYRKLGKRAGDCGLDGLEDAFICLVEVGSLLRDIGRPPFGQAGELALCGWFDSHMSALGGRQLPLAKDDIQGAALLNELCRFDAQAQALRTISKQEGISLTHVQGAVLLGEQAVWREVGDDGRGRQGYCYRAESDQETAMRGVLGLGQDHRHPASYVVDAAEVIARTLSRLEAVVERGLIDPTSLVASLKQAYVEGLARQGEPWASLEERRFSRHGVVRRWSLGGMLDWALRRYERDNVEELGRFFHYLRLALGRTLVNHAADAFVAHLKNIREGQPQLRLLSAEVGCRALLEAFDSLATRVEYRDPELERLELEGYRTLCGLLDAALPALRLPEAAFVRLLDEGHGASPRLTLWVKRLPPGVLRVYRQAMAQPWEGASREVWEAYHRGRLVHDWICSMTESSALEEYSRLRVAGRSLA